MLKTIARKLVQLVTGTRKFYYRELTKIASSSDADKVLEIGSGRRVNGRQAYSAIHLFSNASQFQQTDINPEHGHQVLDITKMSIEAEYDLILCLNVLEHVYESEIAINNLYQALTPTGVLIVAVPFAFPLHDEPHDYYRFTVHALKRMLHRFSEIEVKNNGFRICPFGYLVIAKK